MRPFNSLSIIVCVLVSTTCLSNCFGEDVENRRLLAEKALPALEFLERTFSEASGHAEIREERRESPNATPTVRSRVVDFARSHGMGRIVIERTTPDPARIIPNRPKQSGTPSTQPFATVYLVNQKYAMSLTKVSKEAEYAVTQYTPTLDSTKRTLEREFGRYWDAAFRPGYSTLANLLKLRPFVLDRVTTEKEAEKTVSKFHYHFEYEDEGKPNVLRVKSGWFTLSPDDHWCVLSYSVMTPHPSGSNFERQMVIEYGEIKNGVRIPRRITEKHISHPKGATSFDLSVDTVHFTRYDLGPVEDGEFTASAFGLPDFGAPPVQGETTKPRPSGSIVLVILFMIAGLACAWFLLRQRKARPSGKRNSPVGSG